ncbi:hypothetical protein POM88_023967 [Heracleum sosnowskyi]|uniref:Uncharacterized protein n=1 Tax=Heracleum sosnowskyi TaxID=360622 RepID=A0AAD8IKU7_9APIA|nr:hypothetical protein POM88_023967 [Heracleum sosnowskyi]
MFNVTFPYGVAKSLLTILLCGNATLSSPSRQGTSSARFIYQFVNGQSIGSAFLRGSSLFGGIKFNSYEGAFGCGMSGGARLRGGTSTLQQYGSYGSGGKYGGCREYLSDQMNAPYGEMMYYLNNANGDKCFEVVHPIFHAKEISGKLITVLTLNIRLWLRQTLLFTSTTNIPSALFTLYIIPPYGAFI